MNVSKIQWIAVTPKLDYVGYNSSCCKSSTPHFVLIARMCQSAKNYKGHGQ